MPVPSPAWAAVRAAVAARSEAIKPGLAERRGMKKLIIRGELGIRRDAVIEHDGEELICFSVDRQGEWHGPEEVQLWCTVGTEEERETFEKREFVPHWLETEAVDAEALTVIKAKGKLSV